MRQLRRPAVEFNFRTVVGRGLFIIRTIPVDGYSREELVIIYAGRHSKLSAVAQLWLQNNELGRFLIDLL